MISSVLASMQVFEHISLLRAQLHQWRQAGLTIALVPTMGNLHAGHLSLVELAQKHADKVVVSVFVNPLQFGPNEDYEQYPRTFEADKMVLEQFATDVLFYPSASQMYPSTDWMTQVVAPNALTSILEGSKRPGHFDGVTTVVAKLFHIVQPDLAVFGQKDYQQFAVIQAMVEGLFMPVRLIRAAIVRDKDGLALSSRNQYLSPQQRQIAPKLAEALVAIETALASGNVKVRDVCDAAYKRLLQQGFDDVDYIEVRDAKTLAPCKDLTTSQTWVILAVARLGKTRLLDNRIFQQQGRLHQ